MLRVAAVVADRIDERKARRWDEVSSSVLLVTDASRAVDAARADDDAVEIEGEELEKAEAPFMADRANARARVLDFIMLSVW